jgi:hypothetical protein
VTTGVRVTATISDESSVRSCSRCIPLAGARAAMGGHAVMSSGPRLRAGLGDGLPLTKIRKLLVRHGVEIARMKPAPSIGSIGIKFLGLSLSNADRRDDTQHAYRAGLQP